MSKLEKVIDEDSEDIRKLKSQALPLYESGQQRRTVELSIDIAYQYGINAGMRLAEKVIAGRKKR